MRIGRALLGLSGLLVAALACGLPTPTDTGPTEDLDAIVAGTLTAVASEAAPATEAPVTTTPEIVPPAETPVDRIVYTDAGSLWILEGPGPAWSITSGGGASQPRISSDGQRVAYIWRATPDGHGELRAAFADGSGDYVVLSAAGLDALYPWPEYTLGIEVLQMEFLPGTHTLIFNTRFVPEFIGYFPNDNLLAIDVDTGVLTTLLPPDSGGDFAIAPDGSRIALSRPTSLSLVDADGTDYRPDLVTFPTIITYSEYLYSPRVVWSPDSSTVGSSIPSADPLAPGTSGSVWTIPAAGGSPSLLSTQAGQFLWRFQSIPALAPDLSHVAFYRETATPNILDLYIASSDGTSALVYDTGDINWLGWSPDGVHFLYSMGGPGAVRLGTVGAASAPFPSGIDFQWRSNTEYLFLVGSMGSWSLMRGTLGGAPVLLASPAGDFIDYDFTR